MEEERGGGKLKCLPGVATCCVILIAATLPLKETYVKECKRKNYIVPQPLNFIPMTFKPELVILKKYHTRFLDYAYSLKPNTAE